MSTGSSASVTIGMGLGNMIAVAISWSINHSILWAFLHGLFGWWYVLYYYLGNGR